LRVVTPLLCCDSEEIVTVLK